MVRGAEACDQLMGTDDTVKGSGRTEVPPLPFWH
jgi:hypothetical protein